LSFAGENRQIAEGLADLLDERKAAVFFDSFYKSELLGKKLFGEIYPRNYGKNTRFFVPLISEYYIKKPDPLREFFEAQKEAGNRTGEFILPLRLDDAVLRGLEPDTVYVDLRLHTLEEAADILIAKLSGLPSPGKKVPIPTRWVATFGIVLDSLFSKWQLPSDVPMDYPSLCDWLEQDLSSKLHKANITELSYPEASARDGETLSVRVAFMLPEHKKELSFGDLAWWELLELIPYSELYAEEH
jgi:hypothetical protein